MNFCSEVGDGQSNGRRSPSISALFPFLSRAKDAEPLSRSLLVWWCCKNELVKGSSRHMPLPSRFSKSCCFIKKRGHQDSSPRLPPHSDGATRYSYKTLSHEPESSPQLASESQQIVHVNRPNFVMLSADGIGPAL